MTTKSRPKYCHYCDKQLLVYSSGKHKIYCNIKCKTDYLMEKRADIKYKIYLGQVDNLYKKIIGGKQKMSTRANIKIVDGNDEL